MTVDAKEALIRRFYDDMWNRWDEDVARAILAPDVTFRGSIGLERRGHDGFIEYMRIIRRAFPDFHNRIEELIVGADKAVARMTYTGTHRGTLLGHPPSERHVRYAGIAIFGFRDDRIASVWVQGDMLSLLRQIGALPE
jgi:steroid delta-isomerase-like uncharacterized protein